MKKSLLLPSTVVLLLCSVLTAFAQIPNAGFESWTAGNPDGWFANNITGLSVPVTQSSTAHGGSSAVRGEVKTLVTGGPYSPQIITGALTGGGFSWNQRSGSLTGWYQFSPVSGDRLTITSALYKGGVSGTGVAIEGGVLTNAASSYTQFSVPFTYITNDVPDWATITVVIVGPSSSSSAPHAGSFFLLDDLAFSGTASAVEDAAIPLAFSLEQNYPNPFNPSTKINFSVAQPGHVLLKVYSLLGTEVASLVNGQKGVGSFNVNWNAAGLSSGMYLYRLSVTSEKGILFDQTKKLVVLK